MTTIIVTLLLMFSLCALRTDFNFIGNLCSYILGGTNSLCLNLLRIVCLEIMLYRNTYCSRWNITLYCNILLLRRRNTSLITLN